MAAEQWARPLQYTVFRFLAEEVSQITGAITILSYEIARGRDELSCSLRCSTLYVRRKRGWRVTLHRRWSPDPTCA